MSEDLLFKETEGNFKCSLIIVPMTDMIWLSEKFAKDKKK